jgi:hypothetical protein
MTSDEFFAQLKDDHPKYDVIFIDGLHLSWQVKRDIENSVKHLSDNGFIVLHDCNPPSLFYARENYFIDGQQYEWNGTVWKALYWARTHRKDLKCCVVDTDWGIGIVRKNLNEDTKLVDFSNPFYEYNTMCENRIEDLGLIGINELDNWIK